MDTKPLPFPQDLLGANVPRYTSYPTAPHFHWGIAGKEVEGWLRQLPAGEPLSLYVHIPFCDSLCWFCACHTTAVNAYAPVKAYCDLLLTEIGRVADILGPRRKVRHIHWGGGSPTILDDKDIGRLNGALRDRFEVVPGAEFAVEIDPRGFTPAKAAVLARAGVTRASLGVQDCDPAVQRAINRMQSDDETFDAIAQLRSEGIGSINIDLVYGLPRQTMESWTRTLEFILWLRPERIAVFGYAHVPGFKKHQALIPTELLPDSETRFRMAELARLVLCARGYVAVGIDHYALPDDPLAQAAAEGGLHRNFQGYTTDPTPTLIGFGASAISSFPQGYAQNAAAVPDYRRLLQAGGLAAVRGIAMRDQDRLRRAVIEKLMCNLEVDLAATAGEFGLAPSSLADASGLERLEAQGLISRNGWRVTVPHQWRSATRLVAACFDQHLEKAETRHSVAV
jgi:oxygen-independent coproporphyrinogen-3 oxidase